MKITISISGGIAEAVSIPEGVEVEIRDYDIEGCCESLPLKEDNDGDKYQSIILN